MNISLDGLKMHAVETDPNGVIGIDTIFTFYQSGSKVTAEYSGGQIEQGYLVGIVEDLELCFCYCQLEKSGNLNSGHSTCELSLSADSLIQIIEHFQWQSKPGGGRNIIQELLEREA
jgi:hypothetical protein